MGRHPVLLASECPGFVANRLQAAILREALALIEAGIASPSTVDQIVVNGLAPRWAAAGPIGIADLGGLDIWERVSVELFPLLSAASQPSPLLTALVETGHLGAKSGRGFYEHVAEIDARTFDTMKRHFELGAPRSGEALNATQ
nr:3-hydroxyacyl-CoA dehydrogenase family protein [Microbacterium yannicii]